MGDDYEIRTYYCHCGEIVPQDRQSYRYCEGRVWFTVSEIGDRIGYDDDVVSNAIAEIMPHLSSDKTYEREFKSTLKHISPDYRIKCYDVNVMKAVMHKLHERDVEFLLWAQSISGSRSGATILGGLAVGVSRKAAAEFSFFLALPVMLGASGFKLAKFLLSGVGATAGELLLLAVGSIVAYLTSLFILRALTSFVARHSFRPFAWYRILLGAIVLFRFFLVSR